MIRHVVTVDGRDGSGKSRLAASIAAGTDARLVRVDDFRQPIDWAAEADPAAAYYDRYYDFAALDRVVAAYLAGAGSADAPEYDSIAERVAGVRTVDFEDAAVLVVEGVLIRRVAAAAEATSVYIRASEDEARRRIVDRDLAKGRTRADVDRRIDRRYFPAQRRYHREHRPEASADIVVDHETLGRLHVIRAALGDVPDAARRALARALPDLATRR